MVGSDFRKTHEIVVSGACPAPLESFDAVESEFGKPLAQRLRAQGYTAPTPIQAQAWPLALQGQDVVGIAKAGTGKTCAFLLPAFARLQHRAPRHPPERDEPARPRVLVIVPTRELAQQIAGEAAKFADISCTKVATLYGGVPKLGQVRELKDGPDLVIATPGRLIDFSEGNLAFDRRPLVSFEAVTYLVLDEADRMLDMGFGPDVRKVIGQCPPTGRPQEGGGASGPDAGSKRQTLFFTATWPEAVQKTAMEFTSKDATRVRVGQGGVGVKLMANSDVSQNVFVIPQKDKFIRLLHVLHTELLPAETAIVFVKTKRTCDSLEARLYDPREKLKVGTWCRGIHSGKEQAARDRIMAAFRAITTGAERGKSEGRRAILVATDVAARGLDIPGVALVVVYDFSGGSATASIGAETYVHRIGRTARAGKSGKSFAFFTPKDVAGAGDFVHLLKRAGQAVPSELRALAALPQGKPKALKKEAMAIVARSRGKAAPKGDRPQTAQQNTWLRRMEERLGCGHGMTKRSAKRARQKAERALHASGPAKLAAPACPQDEAHQEKKKCKHKRHRLAAKAAKEAAETASAAQQAAPLSSAVADGKAMERESNSGGTARVEAGANWRAGRDAKGKKRRWRDADAGTAPGKKQRRERLTQ
mmetsp:Transcript_9156/g.23946  ORF Transcript_9156/g.23946 Transcript_9156/m.23946 type:complete len:648 (+) Transcript_9156:143-2086(+)